MTVRIHPSWHTVLASEFDKPYWHELTSFVKNEYSHMRCFPEGKNIFRAFDLTPFDQVKVVILGQDPYHTAYIADTSRKIASGEMKPAGQPQGENPPPICAAMGLSFSVPDGSKPQPSLRNIFKELRDDMGIERTKTDLIDWAEQGVLLLNAVLTVREGVAASHQGKGWENFTDAAIRALSEGREGIVFILWGNFAISKKSLIDEKKHYVITSPHPSPFSADRGFFGSKPFSRTNEYLEKKEIKKINW